MKTPLILLSAVVAVLAVPCGAASLTDALIDRMGRADVVVLGEVHDNPDHHALQAEAIAALNPKAIVWEMLTEQTAARITGGWLDDPEHREQMIGWANENWPNFDLYRPVVLAAKDRDQYGGLVPRPAARDAMEIGAGAVFGAAAAEYGLLVALTSAQQTLREAQQQEAHCNAMPAEYLPKMVAIQRLRDAVLARAVVQAVEDTGGPVVVITGNGHARNDWGVPVYLKRVRPDLRVFALGQSEDGSVRGIFDAVVDSAAVERPDPCAAFEKKQSE